MPVRFLIRCAIALLCLASLARPCKSCVVYMQQLRLGGVPWESVDWLPMRCKDTSRAIIVGAVKQDRWGAYLERIEGSVAPSEKPSEFGRPPIPPKGIERLLAFPNPPFALPPDFRVRWIGQLGYMEPFDLRNPTAAVTVAHGDTALGRLRRAHMVGPIRTIWCGWNNPDGEAPENVFASRAADSVGCRMFARSWNGLWYLIDGNTGHFHDVVVPDTAVVRLESEPGSIVLTLPMLLLFSVLLLGVLALALREMLAHPWKRLTIAMGVSVLISGSIIFLVGWIGRYLEGRIPNAVSHSSGWEWSPPPLRPTDTTRSCQGERVTLLLPPRGIVGGKARIRFDGRILNSIALEPVAPPRGVAWDDQACEGFVEDAPGRYVHVDGVSGSLRRAYVRERAHFFSWPDTTPEVPQWWQPELLLPPGREPDVVVLDPIRIEIPQKVHRAAGILVLWLLVGEILILAGSWISRSEPEPEPEAETDSED